MIAGDGGRLGIAWGTDHLDILFEGFFHGLLELVDRFHLFLELLDMADGRDAEVLVLEPAERDAAAFVAGRQFVAERHRGGQKAVLLVEQRQQVKRVGVMDQVQPGLGRHPA